MHVRGVYRCGKCFLGIISTQAVDNRIRWRLLMSNGSFQGKVYAVALSAMALGLVSKEMVPAGQVNAVEKRNKFFIL